MNGTPSGGCVGNGFIRSETLDNLHGLLNGNFPRQIFEVFPFNLPIWKQERAECINAFPTQNWTFRFKMLPQKRYRAGNGVTITANPRAKLAAGPPRQIPICRFPYLGINQLLLYPVHPKMQWIFSGNRRGRRCFPGCNRSAGGTSPRRAGQRSGCGRSLPRSRPLP